MFTEYGEPDPAAGAHEITSGTVVVASMPDPIVMVEPGIRKQCTGFEGQGAVPASGVDLSVTFAMDEPSTITWQWKTQYLLSVLVLPAGSGSITLDGAYVATGWYDEGDDVEMFASPAADYEFTEWTGDIASNVNPLNVTMDSPKEITANFIPVVTDPYPKEWDYEDGAQGWMFSGKVNDFSELFPLETSGTLGLLCSTNVNSFGFWYSPDDAVEAILDDRMLYRATFEIASDQDKAVTPSFRVRWNALNQQQGDALQIISNDGGDAMPGPEGQKYNLFFRPQHDATAPANQNGTLAFDMINFNDTDSTEALVTLRSVELNRADLDILTSPPVLVSGWYFEDDEEDWTDSSPFDIGPFTHPVFSHSDGELRIETMDNNSFGFWSAPGSGIQNDRMFIVRLKAGVQIVEEDGKNEQPTMRVRIFDSQNHVNGMTQFPVWAQYEKPEEVREVVYKDYYAYFVNQGGPGGQIGIQIDLVNLGDNSPDVTILQIAEVELMTVEIPEF